MSFWKKLAIAAAVVVAIAVVAAVVTVATGGTGAAAMCAVASTFVGAAKGAAIGAVTGAVQGAAEKRVISTTVNKVNRLTELDIDGEVIQCTETHPFQVKGKGWVNACELVPGDVVYTKDVSQFCSRISFLIATIFPLISFMYLSSVLFKLLQWSNLNSTFYSIGVFSSLHFTT